MASPLAELLRDVKVLHKFQPSEHQAGYFVFFKKESLWVEKAVGRAGLASLVNVYIFFCSSRLPARHPEGSTAGVVHVHPLSTFIVLRVGQRRSAQVAEDVCRDERETNKKIDETIKQ